MKLIEQWWKPWSVKLLIAAGIVAEMSAFLPDIQEALPGDWYVWAFRIILIARIVKQNSHVPAA